jgi:D-serine deaminase-like pyridoxal phosphate-dependent protein
MAAFVGDRGLALRPHVKTHSSAALAGMQLAAGANGLTAATLGMAEGLARSGARDVFIANSLWVDDRRAEVLRALAAEITLAIGIDSVAGARALAAAAGDEKVRAVVEIDSGEHRAGVGPADAGEVAAAARAAGLEPIGAFTHGGHSYASPDAGPAAGADEVGALAEAGDALAAAGIEVQVLSAGSTPSVAHSSRTPVTEQRPGTYVFGDRQQHGLGAVRADQIALFAVATVVSTAVPGQVVLDAGAKTLAKDRPEWLAGHGSLPAYPGALVTHLYDYHAVVKLPEGSHAPALGETVAVVPNHACAAVNLSDEVFAIRSGRVERAWSVDLRARN